MAGAVRIPVTSLSPGRSHQRGTGLRAGEQQVATCYPPLAVLPSRPRRLASPLGLLFLAVAIGSLLR